MTAKKIVSNYDRQVDLARAIFLQHDQAPLIRKFRLTADNDYLYLHYFRIPFRICRKSGRVDEQIAGTWEECRRYNTVMTIYDLLCFHKGTVLPASGGSWQTIGSFVVSGVQTSDAFTKEHAAFLDAHLNQLPAACQSLGGSLQSPMGGADLQCIFPVTDFFSVMLQFWAKDEEFPPKVSLLWDRNALEFLHFETTFYLQGDLLERLIACLQNT